MYFVVFLFMLRLGTTRKRLSKDQYLETSEISSPYMYIYRDKIICWSLIRLKLGKTINLASNLISSWSLTCIMSGEIQITSEIFPYILTLPFISLSSKIKLFSVKKFGNFKYQNPLQIHTTNPCKSSYSRTDICVNHKSNSICSLTDHLGPKTTKERSVLNY